MPVSLGRHLCHFREWCFQRPIAQKVRHPMPPAHQTGWLIYSNHVPPPALPCPPISVSVQRFLLRLEPRRHWRCRCQEQTFPTPPAPDASTLSALFCRALRSPSRWRAPPPSSRRRSRYLCRRTMALRQRSGVFRWLVSFLGNKSSHLFAVQRLRHWLLERYTPVCAPAFRSSRSVPRHPARQRPLSPVL